MEEKKHKGISVREPVAKEFKMRAQANGYTQSSYLKYLLDLDREYRRFKERCV